MQAEGQTPSRHARREGLHSAGGTGQAQLSGSARVERHQVDALPKPWGRCGICSVRVRLGTFSLHAS